MKTPLISENRRARHDYHILEKFEAGLVLQGWEVKAMRAARVQLNEAFVVEKDGELFLFNAHVSALESTSGWSHPLATRWRKLLLNAAEIRRLHGKVAQDGMTIVPLDLHFKGSHIKCEIALVKGKKDYDKRHAERERDWQREKQRLMNVHRR